MIDQQHIRGGLVVAAMLGVALAGCTHQASPSTQIRNGLSEFSSARNQTVALVSRTKRSLGAADLNTLSVAYSSLEEKANAYASFMVEAVNTSSFDPNKNSEYAANLTSAIASFNKTYSGLEQTRQTAIATTWVSPFAQTLQTHWDQYNAIIAKMSPQTKADLVTELKRDSVWPNYEDIATEPVTH